MTTDQIQNAIVIYGKLQSTLHDVERMLESDVKRELKQKCTQFANWLEPLLNNTTKLFDDDGCEAFIELTRQLDRVGLEFKVETVISKP